MPDLLWTGRLCQLPFRALHQRLHRLRTFLIHRNDDKLFPAGHFLHNHIEAFVGLDARLLRCRHRPRLLRPR